MGLFDKILGPPNEDAFAGMLIKALRQAGDTREAAYDKDEFQLQFREGDKECGIANLRNMYMEYCSVTRAERKGKLQGIVRGLLSTYKEPPADFEDACSDVLPIVRSKSYLEFTSLQAAKSGDKALEIPHQEIGDHLMACLAYDLPESMMTITDEQLEKWGTSFYEAMEKARQNLQEMEFAFAKIGDGFYGSATGDNYDASRLLMLDLIRRLEVNGSHVAMVPNRDTLLITGSDDVEGLGMMADLAENALENPRPMSAIPMRLDGDEWVSWMPDRGHPHFGKFHLLNLKTMAGEYADQKQLLEELHEQQGMDIFVGSFNAVKKDNGEAMSYCVWSDGVDTLLPCTDKVMFFRDGQDVIASGEWGRVMEIMGDLMQPKDTYPPRYRVAEFPSDEQLAMIGNDGT